MKPGLIITRKRAVLAVLFISTLFIMIWFASAQDTGTLLQWNVWKVDISNNNTLKGAISIEQPNKSMIFGKSTPVANGYSDLVKKSTKPKNIKQKSKPAVPKSLTTVLTNKVTPKINKKNAKTKIIQQKSKVTASLTALDDSPDIPKTSQQAMSIKKVINNVPTSKKDSEKKKTNDVDQKLKASQNNTPKALQNKVPKQNNTKPSVKNNKLTPKVLTTIQQTNITTPKRNSNAKKGKDLKQKSDVTVPKSLTPVIVRNESNLNEASYPKKGDKTIKKNNITAETLIKEDISHDKWIVVTSISSPTADIAKLAAIPGWTLLVVGDVKTPKNWSFPGCVYLDMNKQESLGYSIFRETSTKSYPRKNIGYLYAIQHGAQYIYDTGDDNHPEDGILNFPLEPISSGLVYTDDSKHLMNPYAHFGQPKMWPRGFPLDKVTQENNSTYTLTTFQTPAIQQGLVNGDPDVDAIYQLLNKKQNVSSLNIEFVHSSPPVVLPDGVFAPFNSQNTLFHYSAFWALLLPQTVAFRVTDIWRGYWAQKLLWLIGQRLAFFPPNAVQIRNPNNYISDIQEELQFYSQTGAFVDFLSGWNCSKDAFNKCIKQLSRDMMKLKFWGAEDVLLVDTWLDNLESVGYKLPTMVTNKGKLKINKDERSVFYTPYIKSENSSERLLDLFAICDGHIKNVTSKVIADKLLAMQSYKFPNILLVIVFNFPFMKNIKYLDTMYRDHFPNIVFCSQVKDYRKMIREVNLGLPQWRIRNITFLNITSKGGKFGYECAIRSIEMNYQVDGYLVVADDIMLNIWNFREFDFNYVDFQFESHRFINRNATKINWAWWGSKLGRKPLINALDEIVKLANSSKREDAYISKIFKLYIQNRLDKNVTMNEVSRCMSDMYYIPRSNSNMFKEVMKIFLKYNVFLELAVPTAIVGLEDTKMVNSHFTGSSLWYRKRRTAVSFFEADKFYIHPVKFSHLIKGPQFRDYCDNYVGELLKTW